MTKAEATRLSTPATTSTNEGSGPHAVDKLDKPAPEKKSNRKFLILGAVVAVGLGAVGGHAVLTAGQENTDDAQVEADVVAIAPRVSGVVLRVFAADNQSVKAGDVLLELDSTDLSVKVAQAQAELGVAQAQAAQALAQEQIVTASAGGGLSSAKAQVSSSRSDVQSAAVQIAVAKASVDRAQSDAKKSEIDLKHARELFANNAVSQDFLNSAQVANDSAQASLTQATAGLVATQSAHNAAISRVADAQGKLTASTPVNAQIAAAHAQSELGTARVAAAQAALTLAERQLSYTKVISPQDGVVSKLTARVGQIVAVSQALAVVVPNATYLVANFKETQVGKMHAGDKVKVEIDTYPGTDFEGEVQSLAGGTGARFSLLPPDNASGNFVKVVQRVPVRIAWKSQPSVSMRAGLSADVTVFVK